jgi:hypothetical protein
MLFDILPSEPSYLDPVSSGAILQVLLAIFLGISLFARAFWRKINSFLGQLKEKYIKRTKEPSALGTNNKSDKT